MRGLGGRRGGRFGGRGFGRLALRADALEFDAVAGEPVARRFDLRDQRLAQLGLVQFGDVAALLAHHQNAVLALREVVTDRERVDRFDAVNQARREQKVERAIHRGRRRSRMDLAHFVE
ncbi:hypothetical protein PT2222_190109 [Paraburkholderia tropica]